MEALLPAGPTGQEKRPDVRVFLQAGIPKSPYMARLSEGILQMGVAEAPVCNLSLLYTTYPCVVPIIPLPGITLANFASRHVEQWFHISRAKLCYQSQLLPPSQVAITLDYRYLVSSSLATPTRGILQNEQTPGSTSHNHIWVTV